MARILVLGASKGIGLATVQAALKRNHSVRALARSASRIPIHDERLSLIDGDATDAPTLKAAIAGVDVVVLTLGAPVSTPFSSVPVTLFSKATRLTIAAMKETGVRRLVVITGFGAGDTRGAGGILYSKLMFPLLLSRVYEDKDVQEQMVKASGLEWTIFRPGILTNGPPTNRRRAITDPSQWRLKTISRADVAEAVIEEVERPAYVGKAPVLIAD